METELAEKPFCLDHSGMCQRLVNLEEDCKEMKMKFDRFFWFLLVTLVASLGSLGGVLLSIMFNQKIAETVKALHQVSP